MADDHRNERRSSEGLGRRAAALTFRPLAGAVEAGIRLERRALSVVIDPAELERALSQALDTALDSGAARRLVDGLFDSGLIDHFLDRLLAGDGLWRVVDEVAASPSVTAAISQQGLGFADQVGDQVRIRSRKADEWLERRARRLAHLRSKADTAESDGTPP